MSGVNIKINGRGYDIACGDGEEKRILELAKYIDQTVAHIAASSPKVISETALLVMASLVIADELYELELKSSKAPKDSSDDEKHLSLALDHLTQRVEALAKKLKSL